MKRAGLLFLIFTSFSVLTACKEKKQSPEEYYAQRAERLIPYLKEYYGISINDCKRIFLLQMDKCVVCSDVLMEKIAADSSVNSSNTLIMLTKENKKLDDFLKKNFPRSQILIAEEHLQENGLNFMEHLEINACGNKMTKHQYFN